MRMQIHTLSRENYPQIIEWMENIFTEMGLSQKEIYKGEILLEENKLAVEVVKHRRKCV